MLSFSHSLETRNWRLKVTFHSAKRYERMMRAHGIAPNAANIKTATAIRAPKSGRCESSGSSSKKRKADQFLEENPADDDEGYGLASITVKSDPVDTKETFVIKEEEQRQGQLDLEQAAKLMQYYDNNSQYGGDHIYGGNEYGGAMSRYGTSSGYATPMEAAFGIQSPTDYYTVPYGSASMSGSGMPRSQQGFQYQPALQYQSEDQGNSDSPVLVE